MCRYIVVGIFVYGIEYFCYLLLILYFYFSPLFANATAKVVAGLVAYFFHRVYTFRKNFYEDLYMDFAKYVVVLLINIPLFGLIFYAVNLIGLDYKITKIIADIFCIFIAYVQARFLVFNVQNK